jgi:hypothetical protein
MPDVLILIYSQTNNIYKYQTFNNLNKIMNKRTTRKFKNLNFIKMEDKRYKTLNINVFVDHYGHIDITLLSILNYIVKANIKIKYLFTSNRSNIKNKIFI